MSYLKSKSGWIVLAVLSLLPILPWYLLKPIETRFASPVVTLASFGQVAGLVGMSMFALMIVLSGRFKFMEDYFGGMDKVYVAHHIFGGTAFMLLLFHPLFLASRYLFVSVRSAALFLIPSGDWTINFGIIALLSLMFLLFLTFFVRLPYQVWKFSHRFLGFAFFFAGLHAFLIPSDISRSMFLRGYILILASAAITVFVYRSIASRSTEGKFRYTVRKIQRLRDNITEIELAPLKKAILFVPGQFVFMGFKSGKMSPEVHPFSVSSAAPENGFKLTIKALGDYTKKLAEDAAVGDEVEIEGAFGRFSYQNFGLMDQIWVAGGIGITPFLSMAQSIDVKGTRHRIDLYYTVKNKDEAIHIEELQAIADKNKTFRVTPFYSDEKGLLTAETIKTLSKGLFQKEILLCGPPRMMEGLRKQMIRLKVPSRNIHSEQFKLQ